MNRAELNDGGSSTVKLLRASISSSPPPGGNNRRSTFLGMGIESHSKFSLNGSEWFTLLATTTHSQTYRGGSRLVTRRFRLRFPFSG